MRGGIPGRDNRQQDRGGDDGPGVSRAKVDDADNEMSDRLHGMIGARGLSGDIGRDEPAFEALQKGKVAATSPMGGKEHAFRSIRSKV
jgi:hypothetical protein